MRPKLGTLLYGGDISNERDIAIEFELTGQHIVVNIVDKHQLRFSLRGTWDQDNEN